jgi:hypothetical protein
VWWPRPTMRYFSALMAEERIEKRRRGWFLCVCLSCARAAALRKVKPANVAHGADFHARFPVISFILSAYVSE